MASMRKDGVRDWIPRIEPWDDSKRRVDETRNAWSGKRASVSQASARNSRACFARFPAQPTKAKLGQRWAAWTHQLTQWTG
jgi:hypothetical protein